MITKEEYAPECERTFFLAPPDPDVKNAFAAMQEARHRGLAMVRPGVSCAELDAADNENPRTAPYHYSDLVQAYRNS